ncbi:Glycoside hydrolase [Hyphomicrobiales bacterium]|nr:Glycoside hydrolase [Hyphomicrobiales bacterium]
MAMAGEKPDGKETLGSIMQGTDVNTIANLEAGFATPPEDSRIMMRWWWFGPVIEEEQLDREMLAMKDAGIGGFELAFLYPMHVDDEPQGFRTHRFLSDSFLKRVNFVSRRALELGLRMDVTIGSGWSYGGPTITEDLAAQRLRTEVREVAPGRDRMVRPVPYTHEKLVAVLVGKGSKQEMPRSYEVVDISGEGELRLPASEGPRVVVFCFSAPTGQVVKRATIGAEGYVLDHMKRDSIERHLADVGDKLMAAVEPGSVHSIFCDSLEVYGGNWTDDLLEEFRRRRSYDLTPYLPFIEHQIGETSPEIRRDFGRTLAELYEENFLVPMRAWADRHGVHFRIQNYGMPPASITSHRHAGLIEGEGFGWAGIPQTKWASSAGHLFGKPVISSETWTWIHSPSFRATPVDMKGEADQHFLLGINQLIGHGWPYSPPEAGKPGWMLYAAGALSNTNPWWPVMPDLARYLHRASFLLRQGEPVASVGLYAPTHDALGDFEVGTKEYLNLWKQTEIRIGKVIPRAIRNAGFDFDLFDDGTLAEAEARPFACIVLPNVRFLPEDTSRWLQAFAARGGQVVAVGRRPEGAWPGLTLIAEEELAAWLPGHVTPDMRLAEPSPDVGFVRRRLSDGDVYFVANTGAKPAQVSARFASEGAHIELWDALHDRRLSVAGPDVALDLPAYGSVFVILRASAGAHVPPAPRALAVRDSKPLQDGWSFAADDGAAHPVTLPHDWSKTPELAHFSGRGRYVTRLSLDRPLDSAARVVLDFGEAGPYRQELNEHGTIRGNSYAASLTPPLREVAVVRVNGREVGSVFAPPYAIDLTSAWQEGENEITIDVYNTAINLLAEGGRLPDMERLVAHYGQRARLQDLDDLKPLPSGLVTVPTLRILG